MQIHKLWRKLFVCLILPMNTRFKNLAVLENIDGIYSYSLKIMANNNLSQPQSENASYEFLLLPPAKSPDHFFQKEALTFSFSGRPCQYLPRTSSYNFSIQEPSYCPKRSLYNIFQNRVMANSTSLERLIFCHEWAATILFREEPRLVLVLTIW